MTLRPDNIPRVDPVKRVDPQPQQTPSSGGPPFSSYMEKQAPSRTPPPPTTHPPSPFELAQGGQLLATGPTFDHLLTQVKYVQGMLGDMGNQLQTKNLKLKQSQRHVLRNKLADATTYLQEANTKMGVEPLPGPLRPPGPPTNTGTGVVGKFLDYISDGQSNLVAAQQQLMNLKGQGDNLKPADFLAIQIKLSHAQQELEYASIMLAKVVEDTKTIFNVQL